MGKHFEEHIPLTVQVAMMNKQNQDLDLHPSSWI